MRNWWLEEATPSSTTEAIPFQLRFLFWWWRGHYLQTEVKNSTKRILLLWWRAPSPETMQKPFHQQDDFLNLKRERDREKYQEGRVHTTYTSGSRFRRGSHIFHGWDDNKAMQWEIDDLKKQLHRAKLRRSPSNSNFSSDDEEDTIYRQRSRTPPSESFCYDEERHHRRKCRSPFINKMISSISNVKEIGKNIRKAVYIPPVQVEAASPTSKMIIKPCNERLMTWRSNSIEHNRGNPLPIPISLLMMKRTLFTDRGQELHQANSSPMMKNAITGENAEALLAKEWELTLWKRY